MMTYKEKQRDFEQRAAKTTLLWSDGTCNQGRNKAKNARRRAYATAKGCPGGWKKAVRRIIIAARKAGTVWPSA